MTLQLRQPGGFPQGWPRAHSWKRMAAIAALATAALFGLSCSPAPPEPAVGPTKPAAAEAAPTTMPASPVGPKAMAAISPTPMSPTPEAATPTLPPATPTAPPSPTPMPATPTARPADLTSTPAPTRSAAPAPTATAAPPLPTAPGAAAPSGMAAQAQSIMSRASALRQLPVKDEVPLDNISREQLRTYLLNDFEKENAAEDIEKDRTLLVLLGLLKESDDLREIWLGLLGEQILGFYEFETHKMTLVEAEQELSPKDELSLAHEYVHALQDQNFDLGDRIEKAKGPGERVMGLKALSEGDATLAMGAYARLHMTAEQLAELEQSPDDAASQEKLRAAPLILQLSLLFPYQQGAVFTSTLYLSGGWPAVDRAYSDPPVTTEQVMHPQKYLEREGPKPVDTPDLAKAMGPGWSLWDDDTMGELDWLGYLATFVPADRALRAAAGWGGDRMVLLKSDAGKPALVSASVWDTALDAQEFYSALHDIMQSKPGVQTVSPRVDSLAWTEPSHSGYAGLKGDRVLLIISPDEATTKRLVDAFGGS